MSRDTNYYQNGEDIHFKKITHDEERALFIKAKAGDVEAREFLIRNHLLYVATYGLKHSKGKLRNDEVVSAMNEALMKAIDRFDPNYKNQFARFLIPFLRGAMANLWLSKNLVDLPKEERKGDDNGPTSMRFIALNESTGGRDGECQSEGCRVTKKSAGFGAGLEVGQLRDSSPEPDEVVEESDQKNFLMGMIESFRSKMTDEESNILDLVYRDGLNFAEVAEKRGVSREWIRVKHDEIIKKLRLWFKKEGVTTQ